MKNEVSPFFCQDAAKNAIKREQKRARSSFAEREHFIHKWNYIPIVPLVPRKGYPITGGGLKYGL